jgi:hypothetical protein
MDLFATRFLQAMKSRARTPQQFLFGVRTNLQLAKFLKLL